MTRIVSGAWNEAICEAMSVIPPEFRGLCEAEWVIGVSPIRAGVHGFTDTGDGRGYDTTPHVAYPSHLIAPRVDSLPVVVLPGSPAHNSSDVATVVHEIGHVVHWAIGFGHKFEPVSWYAATNNCEAFAEAWSVYCLGADRMADAFTMCEYRSLNSDEMERMKCLLTH